MGSFIANRFGGGEACAIWGAENTSGSIGEIGPMEPEPSLWESLRSGDDQDLRATCDKGTNPVPWALRKTLKTFSVTPSEVVKST